MVKNYSDGGDLVNIFDTPLPKKVVVEINNTVEHQTFGVGRVIDVQGEICEVDFNGTRKKLSPRFSNIKVLRDA